MGDLCGDFAASEYEVKAHIFRPDLHIIVINIFRKILGK